MPDFTVIRLGTDSSGRGIFATRYMADWWERVCDRLGFTPTVTQGAFMVRNGGGAAASAGYHDDGGCFDVRVWDLTPEQVRRVIAVTRQMGAASWVRDAQRGGMDPHIHFVLGTDKPLASGAAWQWSEYVEGNDGLASRGADYHPRPRPLVLTPPEDDMQLSDEFAKDRSVRDLFRRMDRFITRQDARAKETLEDLTAMAALVDAIPEQYRPAELRRLMRQAIQREREAQAEDPQ